MDWPAQSPDISPIEHFWHHLKRKLAGYEISPKRILELWYRVEEKLNKIPSEVCQNLIESMLKHNEAVLQAMGYQVLMYISIGQQKKLFQCIVQIK